MLHLNRDWLVVWQEAMHAMIFFRITESKRLRWNKWLQKPWRMAKHSKKFLYFFFATFVDFSLML
jgi:hypothetical protein